MLVYTVSATGGTPQPLATPDFEKGAKSCRLPQILPGSKGVLFTMSTSDIDSYDEAGIAVVLLETVRTEDPVQGREQRPLCTYWPLPRSCCLPSSLRQPARRSTFRRLAPRDGAWPR